MIAGVSPHSPGIDVWEAWFASFPAKDIVIDTFEDYGLRPIAVALVSSSGNLIRP